MKKLKIILTGAQGVGKTTLLKEFNLPKISEVVRNLNKNKSVNVNEDGNDEGQLMIWNTYYDLLSNTNTYISDRGLTDVLAYTRYAYHHKRVSYDTLYKIEMEFREFIKKNKDIIYVYVPIEFYIEDDGFRSIDKGFQEEIDTFIREILESFDVLYTTVTGSVNERAEQVVDYIKSLKS